MIFTDTFSVKSKGYSFVADISPDVALRLARSGIMDGVVTVFIPGSTAAVTTIEFEPGAVEDLQAAMERFAPAGGEYKHNLRWGDGNGFSHVRAALMGPSLSIPLQAGQMSLGTWQQIVLVDFDNRSRSRQVVVTIIGE